jgi:hypothetical protein
MAIDFIASTVWPLFWDFRWSKGLKKIKFIIVSLASLAATSNGHAEGMCKDRETVVFNCEMQKSVSSMCESKDTGVLSYRNGVASKIHLEISDSGVRKGPIFYFSNIPYAGGGEAHIRFSRSRYTYYLYDKTVKTDGGPAFSAGIVVYRGERKISNLICKNDASIRNNAYDDIAKESYREIGSR